MWYIVLANDFMQHAYKDGDSKEMQSFQDCTIEWAQHFFMSYITEEKKKFVFKFAGRFFKK